MRLQLTVQRQGLPPTQVLWDTGALRPNHVSSGTTTTIAQLLEHINEVIPLEAEEWGLEDYAVEVNGFECLHFCSLNILKEDDRVTVRPLQTSDLRYRRVSGRHQISHDGKHLIDGVAFGRPFLRRTDRPPVKISSRKRIRLTYDDKEDPDIALSVLNTDQTLVRSVLNDADDEDSDDGGSYELNGISNKGSDNVEGDEEDYGFNEDLEEDLAEELHDITQDMEGTGKNLQNIERFASYDEAGETAGILTRSRKRRKRNGLGLQGEGVLKLLEAGDDQLTGAYHNPLLDRYYQDEPTQSKPKPLKKRRTQNIHLGTSSFKVRQSGTPGGRSRQSSSASTKSVRFEGDEIETPATIREVQDSESEDDEDFEPDAGLVSGSVESNKENVQPPDLGEGQEVSSDGESQSSKASSTSSSSSDASLSPSSSGNTSSSTSAEASTSSSGSTSSPEQIHKSDQKGPRHRPGVRSRNETVAKKKKSSGTGGREHDPVPVPPEKGLLKTQRRNQRRRMHKKIEYLKSMGVLSSTASMEEYYQHVESRSKEECASKKDEQRQVLDTKVAFEAKRKSLLESLASGGADIDQGSQLGLEISNNDQHMEDIDAPDKRPDPEMTAADGDHSQPLITMEAPGATATPDVSSSTPALIPASSNSSQRRSRLNLASSRRLLFGSLGLRTPKNKEDEANLRDKLMENAKPVFQVQGAPEGEAKEGTTDAVDELDNSWRDRIDLKAVECCYDGIALSTPPFPFVQRWDPQQKGRLGNAQGGQKANRRKKRKRNQKQFYQKEEAELDEYSAPVETPEVGTLSNRTPTSEKDQHEELPIHRTTIDDHQLAVDRQLLEDITGISANAVEDLPDLPEDMAMCATLAPELALPGAVIAFKQLDMSQETNWQPKVSEYRTAIINRVLEDNLYQISLSRRDTPRKERLYDRETGERLYSKFEMPEYENDNDNDDDGVAEVSLADMIEPKLIKGVEIQPQAAMPSPTATPEIERIDMSEVVEEEAQDPEAPAVDIVNEVLTATEMYVGPALPSTDLAEDLPVRIREQPNKDLSIEVNEETRQEISLIIKDAGFRSNVHSDLARGLENHDRDEVRRSTKEDVSEGAYEVQSPRFNGFSSSPPAEHRSRQAPEDVDVTEPLMAHKMSSTNIVNMDSSQPNESAEAAEEPLDDIVEQDWGPEQIDDGSSMYPTLPRHADTDTHDQEGSATAEISSSPSTELTKHTSNVSKGRGFLSRSRSLFCALDGADSDEDLPTMESVFSTARSRIDEAIPDSDDAKEDEAAKPSSKYRNKGKEASTSSSRFPRRSIPVFSVDDVLASSSSDSPIKADEPDSSLPKGGGSQPPPGSQIVDLTLSSDPVDPDTSEYEERSGLNGLPSGPGWVQKTRSAGKGRRLQPKAGARKTRSM